MQIEYLTIHASILCLWLQCKCQPHTCDSGMLKKGYSMQLLNNLAFFRSPLPSSMKRWWSSSMESIVRGTQGPLTAGDICNCFRVIRHKMHGCFPIHYVELNRIAMFEIFVLTTSTRMSIHPSKELIVTTDEHSEVVVPWV